MPERTTLEEVHLSESTMMELQDMMADAVSKGIQRAATSEESAKVFWTTGVKVFQDQATRSAGRFVLGGLRGLLRKLSTFVVLGAIVYSLGGWDALADFVKLLYKGTA